MSTEVIAWYAVLYGAFIVVFGLLGFYWWTVVKRWAECCNDETRPDMTMPAPSYNMNHSMESMHSASRQK